MRIRELRWRDDFVWFPVGWPPEHDAMVDKNGVLKKVGIQEILHPYIHVEIETHKGLLWGVILFEDHHNLETLCHKLKENIGKTLAEIGELEIDFSRSRRKVSSSSRSP